MSSPVRSSAEQPANPPTINDAWCLADIERMAADVLPAAAWDFVAGGSGAERTLAANRAALDRLALIPRIMRDVTRVDTGTDLLGTRAALPVAVAPVAFQRLMHPDGELAAARAAAVAGVPFTIATLSSVPIEQIAATGCATWFQLYWLRDRHTRQELVRRAEAAGCGGLIVTADVPWMGRRLRDARRGFTLPEGVTAANLTDGADSAGPETGSAVAASTRLRFDPSLNWDDLERLRSQTSLPIALKGVLDPADAIRAVESGVDAVIVSNHGGRQLDGAVAGIDALPAVEAAVAGRCRILLDGGIRCGTDVAGAVASGADGVLIGRPAMWGLAAGGQAGVERVLTLLSEELRDAMGLAGCRSTDELKKITTTRLPTLSKGQSA